MKNKIGMGIVLISLFLLVSSQVLAAPRCDFVPLNVGDLFIYDVENSIGGTWKMYSWVSGSAKIDINRRTYATSELMGYDDDNNIEIGLVRTTANSFYMYFGKGEEELVSQNAPVGTSWTFERRGHTIQRIVEAIEDVSVPAGNFTGCVRTCQYEIDDPANPILYTCEWVKPCFGMVQEKDFYTDYAPVVHKLNSKTKYP